MNKITIFFFITIFCVSGILVADLPELISREVLFGNPAKSSPKVSHDGKMLAYLAPDDGVLNVWVRTTGKKDDRVVTHDKNRGIRSYNWAYDNKHILYIQDKDGNENWHLYSVDITKNGAEARDLTPFEGVQALPIHHSADKPGEMVVKINKDNPRLHDAYHLTLKTGKIEKVAENPGNVNVWYANDNLDVIGAQAILPNGGGMLLTRLSPDGEWKKFLEWGPSDIVQGLMFSKDGKYWYIKHNLRSDKQCLYSKDLKTGKEKLLFKPEKADVGTVFKNIKDNTPEAVRVNYLRANWHLLGDTYKEDFAQLEEVHDGDMYVVSRDKADRIWLAQYVTDDGPVYYYTYDRKSKKAEKMFSHKPELEELKLAEMKPVVIEARDGLKLVSYLTLPAGVEHKNLPMVLFVHGGPWARDSWGFNPYAQWLANRGYAVLQVNFRGSDGFGKDFLNAGNRQWGKKMHTDLIDAVNWAIEKGYANPEKIAIMGGSYGGYAALAGAAFTPEVFTAAVDIVGPSNVMTLIKSVPPYWKPLLNVFRHRIGDWEKEPELMKQMSPLFSADNIEIPLLIGQGKNDPRVNVQESLQIVDAIKKNKTPVTYIEYPDEGHGFARPENRMSFNAAAEKFLAEHLGGRYEPPTKEEAKLLKKVTKVDYK